MGSFSHRGLVAEEELPHTYNTSLLVGTIEAAMLEEEHACKCCLGICASWLCHEDWAHERVGVIMKSTGHLGSTSNEKGN